MILNGRKPDRPLESIHFFETTMRDDTPHSLFGAAPPPPRKAKNAKRVFEETLVTLTQLAGMVGAKPRALQLWTDAKALEPLDGTDRKGSGAWRLYSRTECELAAILVEAHKGFHLQAGVLALLAQSLRRLEGDAARDDAFERARRGTHAVWLVAVPEGDSYAVGFSTGAVLSLSALPGKDGIGLRDRPAILVVNLTAALGKLGTSLT